MEARQQNKKSRRRVSSGQGNAMTPSARFTIKRNPESIDELGAGGYEQRAQMRSASRQTIPHKSRDLRPSFIRTIPSAPDLHRILLCQTLTRLAGFTADRELSFCVIASVLCEAITVSIDAETLAPHCVGCSAGVASSQTTFLAMTWRRLTLPRRYIQLTIIYHD